MHSMSIMLSDIFFLYMSNEGCFTFIIQYLLQYMSKIFPYLQKQAKKTVIYTAIQLNIKAVICNFDYSIISV